MKKTNTITLQFPFRLVFIFQLNELTMKDWKENQSGKDAWKLTFNERKLL